MGTSRDAPGVRLKYKPQGPQLHQFHVRPDFVTGLIGPLGSGKTFAAINKLLDKIHNQTPNKDHVRRSRWCVARNTFPDLNSATIPDFRSITDKLPFGEFSMGSPPAWKARWPRADGTVVETEVLFRSFDGPQDVKKARGMQLTGVWIDELGEFNKTNLDILIGRVKRFPPKSDYQKSVPVIDADTGYQLIDHHGEKVYTYESVGEGVFNVLFTSNAVPRDHWLADLALRNTPEGWWIGIQAPGVTRKGNSWVENPQCENYSNLPKGYYKGQIGGKKDSWIRQNLANEFVHHSDGRPVHPDFNEQLHVDDLVPLQGVPLWLGMDWGRTPAAIILQQQPNGQWFALEEVVLTNAGADQLGRTVKRVLSARYAGFDISEATGDPSGDDMAQTQDETPLDLFSLRSGLMAMPAHTNDPSIRFATLDNLLTQLIDGQPAILIDRGCSVLIAGLAGAYQFRRVMVTGQDKYHDKPDKGPQSHVCEALHYGLMGAGESEALFNQDYEAMIDDMSEYMAPDSTYE